MSRGPTVMPPAPGRAWSVRWRCRGGLRTAGDASVGVPVPAPVAVPLLHRAACG